MNARARVALVVMTIAGLAQLVSAAEISWPKEIEATEGKVIVYQPQPETLKGNVLTGRAAMSLELKSTKEPVFGAFWFTARLDTDQSAGVATIRDVKITKVGWRDSVAAQEQRFTQVVEGAIPKAGFEISMERLSASLATAEREQQSLAQIKNDPPKILFAEELAVLLLYDGAPRFSPVESSDYERALNTPFIVVRNKKTKAHYLSSGALWYTAKDPLGPWSTTAPPADLLAMLPKPEADEPAPKAPPKIMVATEPTELIATDGKARWKSMAGGKLLYVENTETAWLRELSGNQMYVLLSGRWFKAAGQGGPWTFVRADQLPSAFKEIPPGSDIGGLRVSVAGTEEAEDAVLDAQIPQTAAIKRSDAKLAVQYDGAPKFEKIAGTAVSYAVNTDAQVLQIGATFYAVDNGVWFSAVTPSGPWKVADKIPDAEIQKIPSSSPVYNTTYVQVYDSTPDVVYVGYRPGYLWSFPSYGVPIYGTGFYYRPYWGSYYYPRPPTWGFHVGYNPWTGWNFGVTWSSGFFSAGIRWGGGWGNHHRPGCCGGWYGGGYRRPIIINTGDINIGNNINIGNRTNIGNRVRTARVTPANITSREGSLYNRPENRLRNVARPQAKPQPQLPKPQPKPKPGVVPAQPRLPTNNQAAAPVRTRDNDVFADLGGNVVRRAGNDWESRESGSWKPAPRLPAQPVQSGAARRPGLDRADLDRSQSARIRGARREEAASRTR